MAWHSSYYYHPFCRSKMPVPFNLNHSKMFVIFMFQNFAPDSKLHKDMQGQMSNMLLPWIQHHNYYSPDSDN